MHQVNIVKLDLSTGKAQTIVDYIAEEKPLYLFVNKTFWATILCSPMNLKELAVGHLLSEGVLASTAEIKEIVLRDKKVSQKIEAVASSDHKQLWEVRKQAGEYFDEIAADFNITYVRLFDMALRWLWKRIFEGIELDTSALATVREWASKGPLIYVPSHKSHIDYLVLNYVLHANHMLIPRIAAGSKLTFWPAGHVFRKSGAFFIRRSFKQPRL